MRSNRRHIQVEVQQTRRIDAGIKSSAMIWLKDFYAAHALALYWRRADGSRTVVMQHYERGSFVNQLWELTKLHAELNGAQVVRSALVVHMFLVDQIMVASAVCKMLLPNCHRIWLPYTPDRCSDGSTSLTVQLNRDGTAEYFTEWDGGFIE